MATVGKIFLQECGFLLLAVFKNLSHTPGLGALLDYSGGAFERFLFLQQAKSPFVQLQQQREAAQLSAAERQAVAEALLKQHRLPKEKAQAFLDCLQMLPTTIAKHQQTLAHLSDSGQSKHLTVVPGQSLTEMAAVYLPLLPKRRPAFQVGAYVEKPDFGGQVSKTFRLAEFIAAGGFGEVWRAETQAQKAVAVKYCLEPSLAAVLKSEAKRLLFLRQTFPDHPHIVDLIDFNLEKPPFWLAFDYIAGGTLQGRLQQAALSAEATWQLLRTLAETLALVHEKGLYHRDLKPANILFTAYGQPKIADFGIGWLAANVQEQAKKTVQTTWLASGTPGFMSPEQQQALPPQADDDVYALGVLAFQCLTGQLTDLPHVWDELLEAQNLSIWIPLIKGCLRSRGKRFADASALLTALENFPEAEKSAIYASAGLFKVAGSTPSQNQAQHQPTMEKFAQTLFQSPPPAKIPSTRPSALSPELTDLFDRAEQGEAAAQSRLAWLYHQGEGLAKDNAQAFYWWQQAALQGNANAQNWLGACYRDGLSVAIDDTLARRWFLAAAEQNEAYAQKNLGYLLKQGRGGSKDVQAALHWFDRSAKQGNAWGQLALAAMYYQGLGVEKDFSQAFYWYHLSAEQGNADAQEQLGFMLKSGEGSAVNIDEALAWYQKAAQQGQATAMYALATLYGDANLGRKNPTEMLYWYHQAANAGDKTAQSELGYRYFLGLDLPVNDLEAKRFLSQAAAQGEKVAQYNLGWMLIKGRGGAKNAVLAAEWFAKAAAQGHADAQNWLGVLHRDGDGVAQDYLQAFQYFLSAAEQGLALGQVNLGFLYFKGLGVKADDNEAFYWFRLAAEQGNAQAQYNIGWLYKEGRGVAKNLVEAKRWYALAADQDHAGAKKALANF